MRSSKLVIVAVIGAVLFAKQAGAQSEPPQNFLWKQCNEDALVLHLDPEPLRQFVGSEFSVTLDKGKARVLIVVQDCTQYWIDGQDLGPTQHAHVWVSIDGPQDIVPVAGAQQTLPRATWFSLSAGSSNPRGREARMASGTAPDPIEGVSLDPLGSRRGGRVIVGADRSYSWSVKSEKPAVRLVGVNHDVYSKDGAGRIVFKRIQALGNLIAGPSGGTLEVVDRADQRRLIGAGTYPIVVYTFFPIWARATLGGALPD